MYEGKPCFFLEIGGVCKDYNNRPKSPCVDYECLWLQDNSIPDFMKPENCNAIFDMLTYKNKKYIRFIKSKKDYSKESLEYAIKYASDNNMVITWMGINGDFNCKGDNEFCEELKKYNNSLLSSIAKN